MRALRFAILALTAAFPAVAADPASGTIDDEHLTTSWTGMFIAPNPGGSEVPIVCEEAAAPLTCDVFRFEVNVSDADVENDGIRIDLAWTTAQMDIDLYVYNDETGEQVGSGTAGQGTSDGAFIPAVNGLYRVEIIPWLAAGESYEGTVTYQRFDEEKSGIFGAGAVSAGVLLVLLAGLGLGLRRAPR